MQPTSLMDNTTVNHIIELTMVDGKVATALSDVTNSSQCCSVCGTKPTQMNNIPLKNVRKKFLTAIFVLLYTERSLSFKFFFYMKVLS